ncbi:MAG: 4-(cytidine 5'-diphospho)-2-C-methyl-D-erythritol kinase [Flavobacteriales bacterium]|nr:MAG: 4-(cytidine 5'-diphospho)-2-C-methyl-D-erythritol kinase [Flavobacteriales bacterium]
MIAFPPAKINLGLNVLRMRADGFHDIESVLVPVPLHDALEIIVAPDVSPGEVVFTSSGEAIPGNAADNLCLKAVQRVKTHCPLPGLRMHLHKVIPMGAGLGGGSSDGAHTIRLLDDLLGLQLGDTLKHELASSLGSDCPFFLSDRPQLATGRGEVLAPIDLDLHGWWLVLVNPGIHVGTPEVYKNTIPTDRSMDYASALRNTDPRRWQSTVTNTMETYVLQAYPAVKTLRDELLYLGADFAAMSGSGSSVFGLFKQKPALPGTWQTSTHRSWCLRL